MAVMEILIKAIDQASDVIQRIGDQAQGLSGKVASTGQAFQVAGGQMTGTGMQMTMMSAPILAAGAGFGVLLKEGMTFEKGMAEVFTLLPGISQQAMDGMIGETRRFSEEFGVLPEETIPALYQALSAGVPPDNVFDFLAVGQQAALGGVTDLTTAVDGITSTVNAYGAEAISAGQASDQMFTAVKLGKTTFEELSRSLFNVNPIAAALGVEFGDVTAAMATMTAQGVPTSVATTQLRQLFVELSKEGGAAAKTFEEISGKSFTEFIASGGNVADALALMQGHAESTGVGIQDLFGSVEAGSAALALSGENASAYAANIDAMANSAGATEEAYNTMADTAQHAADKAAAAFAVMRGEMAEKFLPILTETLIPIFQNQVMPALEKFFDFLVVLAEGFGALPGPVQGVIIGLLGLLAVGGPILMTLGLMTQGAGALMIEMSKIPGTIAFVGRGFRLLGGFTKLMIPGFLAAAKAAWVFTAALLANPITWIVIAIIALIAAIYLLWKNWDQVSAFLIKAWDAIKAKAVEVWEGLKEFFSTFWDGVKEGFSQAWEGIKTFFSGIWEWITGFFAEWGPAILAILVPFIGIPLLIAQHWDTIKETLATAWEGIKEKATSTWDGIQDHFSTFWENIKEKAGPTLEFLRDLWETYTPLGIIVSNWDTITEFLRMAWENIKTFFSGGQAEVLSKITTWASQVTDKAREAGAKLLTGFMEAIKELPTKVWNLLVDVVNKIKQIAGQIWSAAKNIGDQIWSGVKKGLGKSSPGYIEKALDEIAARAAALPSQLSGSFDQIKGLSATPRLELAYAAGGSGAASAPATTTITNVFNFDRIEIRREEDIRELARELYELQTADNRGV